MAVVIWPSELPQRPYQDGYGRPLADGRRFSPMGRGPAKVRRQTTAAVRTLSVAFQMTVDQQERFERFWVEDTDGGTLPYLIIDAVRHEQPVLVAPGVPLLTEDGTPILISAWWLVRFGQDAPQSSPLSSLRYRISFQLEVLP